MAKLIIGLGNPDPEYSQTRHNIGFFIVDKIAEDSEAEFEFDKKINAQIAKGKFNEKPAILLKPASYVNKSGEAVKRMKNKLKIKPADIVVIHDDLDIEFGNFKVSFEKNSGGHKGVQNVIDNLKTNKFWRLRIGTANRKLEAARHVRGRPAGGAATTASGRSASNVARDQNMKEKKELIKDFVLAKFSPVEHDELKKVIKKALEGLGNSIR